MSNDKWVKIPALTKAKIFSIQNFKCYYCGEKITETNQSIDHKIPTSKGGSDNIENLVACCKSCNSMKGGKTINEFRFLLARKILKNNLSSKQECIGFTEDTYESKKYKFELEIQAVYFYFEEDKIFLPDPDYLSFSKNYLFFKGIKL